MRTLLLLLLLVIPASAAKIVLVAGGGEGQDGSPATKAKLITPFGCDFDSKGTLYFVEMEKGERVRRVNLDGTIETVAGNGQKGLSTGQPYANAAEAKFNGMHGLAIFGDDHVLVADTWNNRLAYVLPKEKLVKNFAGSKEGKKGFLDHESDNDKALFGGTFSVCVAPDGFIYVTDLDHKRIRRVSNGSGEVITVAGNGKGGVPTDGGKAIDQPLTDPRACCLDSKRNLYILERGGHALRKVDLGGEMKIRTVAGTGKAGTNLGVAKQSQFNGPKHCCCDAEGAVYIADAENHRVLKYDPKSETVSLVAGTGKKGSAGLDGDPLHCQLNRPHGVTVHPKTGELYICDSYNDRILKITP